ncbi:MAG TPA: glycosyltransferase family 4 protein [Casimicrobiaceae bacterium]|jgi:glycosyltransferase involved in cell wall biosynthesis
MKLHGLKIGLVGPLPPPAGGMANQTRQLAELLQREGAIVTIVQVNLPCRPRFVERIRGVGALVRLVPYVVRLWRVAGRTELLHVMANSGWSWHLYAAPAVCIARLRGTPSVVNYRGGEAETFLARSARGVAKTMQRTSALVVPSGFLQRVFERCGMGSEVVPNIVDIDRFRPAAFEQLPGGCRLVVARNLEPIYDIPMVLRAFSLIVQAIPDATLVIAGSGPDLASLQSLATELGIAGRVDFCGRLDRDQMAELYRSAAVVLNPSRVDNMPNSVLEAMASGVPVVSTNVGGVPFILRDGVTGLLIAAGDHKAMAAAAQRLMRDPELVARLRSAALAEVQQYTWPRVKQQWSAVYAAALSGSQVEVRLA